MTDHEIEIRLLEDNIATLEDVLADAKLEVHGLKEQITDLRAMFGTLEDLGREVSQVAMAGYRASR